MWMLLIIGILIGWGGYYVWANRDIENGKGNHTPKQEDMVTNETPDTEIPHMPAGVSATVGEQPEGMHVFVNAVSTDRTVWVAIREMKDGGLWNILGAARLDAGVYDGGIKIFLTRSENRLFSENFQSSLVFPSVRSDPLVSCERIARSVQRRHRGELSASRQKFLVSLVSEKCHSFLFLFQTPLRRGFLY